MQVRSRAGLCGPPFHSMDRKQSSAQLNRPLRFLKADAAAAVRIVVVPRK